MIKINLFILLLIIFTSCSKTNNQNTKKNTTTKTNNNIWKVSAKATYILDEEITISLQNISDKQVLIQYPDVTKIEQKIGNNWQEIRLVSYPCMAQPPLRRYEPIESQKTQVYSWNQKEKWCEGNTDKTKAVSKGKYRLKISYTFEEDGVEEEFFVQFEIK